MKTIFQIVVAACFLSGCASSLYQEIPADELSKFKNSSAVSVTYYQSPAFYIMTPKSVAGEGLIADWTKSSDLPLGATLVKEFNIAQPTELMVKNLRDSLEIEGVVVGAEYGPKDLPVVEQPVATKNAPYTLEVSTGAWQANYQPLNWKTYTFGMNGTGRLIRSTDNAVVWKGFCQISGYDDERLKFHISEIETADGQKLKEIVAIGSEHCANQLLSQLLNKQQG